MICLFQMHYYCWVATWIQNESNMQRKLIWTLNLHPNGSLRIESHSHALVHGPCLLRHQIGNIPEIARVDQVLARHTSHIAAEIPGKPLRVCIRRPCGTARAPSIARHVALWNRSKMRARCSCARHLVAYVVLSLTTSPANPTFIIL